MYVVVYVRVAVYELVALGVGHVGEVEGSGLLAQLRVEDNVQQQVAQLLAYALHVAVGDGVDEFVGLLYGVVAQRFEGLFAVPRALFAQGIHDFEQPLGGFELIFAVHVKTYLSAYKVTIFRQEMLTL